MITINLGLIKINDHYNYGILKNQEYIGTYISLAHNLNQALKELENIYKEAQINIIDNKFYYLNGEAR